MVVFGQRLDSMTLKVLSNFNDSIIPFDVIMFKRRNYVSSEITKFLTF